jgi:hypothetical protein
MTRVVTGVFVRAHRALFTAATATLGVAASLIASDSSSIGNWLLLVGAGVIMAVEDVCREVEIDARKLAKDTKTDIGQTRADVLGTHHPKLITGAIALGLVALGVGISVRHEGSSGTVTRPSSTSMLICSAPSQHGRLPGILAPGCHT